jgi:hypothetical protein
VQNGIDELNNSHVRASPCWAKAITVKSPRRVLAAILAHARHAFDVARLEMDLSNGGSNN